MDRFRTIEEIAEFLGVPPSWVYARTSPKLKGKPEEIPHAKIGRHLRFDLAEVEVWAKNGRRSSGSQPEDET